MISASALAIGIIVTSPDNRYDDRCQQLYVWKHSRDEPGRCPVCSGKLSMVVLGLYLFAITKHLRLPFDESFAKATGVNVSLYNVLIAVLTAITIVIGMRMMGAMLIPV